MNSENKTLKLPRHTVSRTQVNDLIEAGAVFDTNKCIMHYKGLDIILGFAQSKLIKAFLKDTKRIVNNEETHPSVKIVHSLQDSFGLFTRKAANELVSSGRWWYTSNEMLEIHNGKNKFKINN